MTLKSIQRHYPAPKRAGYRMVEFKLQIEPEDFPVRGNLVCTDNAALDTLYEDEVIERIESGDNWAWCCVHVTAQIPGVALTGDAYLGGCTYDNEPQFRECPYFEDMMNEALEDLLIQLKAASVAYTELKEQLK